MTDVICALSSRCSPPLRSPSHPDSWRQKSDHESKHIDTRSLHKYRSSTQRPDSVLKHFTVYVTDLQVNADVDRVTEGQKVTLTCHTSCPANTQSFIWLKNKNTQGLDLQRFRNQLCFDPVSREHTGRYSCALRHYKSFSSAERFLDVSYASRITTVSSVRSLETRAVTLTYNTLSPLPDVMIDSTGIILLSSLLVLLTLMLIGAAVWRRRREGNESQVQRCT
ncbi:carcinoembryonic antigen-related cell adhesion molecule 21-like [Triplophysa rosa]|uniref:carcinoembryonic antigen-related cell adhesion molecule 21-like n=1 Tax=Triplophysa rosa TaxID=992332 RepID=UPI0025461736|nr:carcinoembryonic antigen-related cell adhesion molecule 21-like [Triplophysa rosa]